MINFQEEIEQGIPQILPPKLELDQKINHAPKRKNILSQKEIKIALRNALRYFPKEQHSELLPEFQEEFKTYGRIYMYRLKPIHKIFARPIQEYPGKSMQAKAIMLMIQNNLDKLVAQHPDELITYGGNGAVFQNWAQYRLCMKYLSEMTDEQTLVMYSGHPLGLFPSSKNAPRVVVTNGMVIPNYSKPDDLERLNALGVSQYGQMTAGSYMYIGPQGIVHGTTITLMNAARKLNTSGPKLFVTSGLGGMSGAQPKAAKIAGIISVTAEVNKKVIETRFSQGWVDKVISDVNTLCTEVKNAIHTNTIISFAYHGNIVDVWGEFLKQNIHIHLGSDQTSLHNPWSGGYYPNSISFDEAEKLIADNPLKFKALVQETLIKHANLIIEHTKKGTYFFDYGNAFLLEASRAGAPILNEDGTFIFPSYVQDIMGPLCFDYGFGPFRWVCASGKQEDLDKSDELAITCLEQLLSTATEDIKPQLLDNLNWIKAAKENQLVVGSKARILYADANGRIALAKAFNDAIKNNLIGPIILGRDHHDVSGTDSPYRETSNIYDGSSFTADMAIHNVIGDAFRGATWVSIHNGGGVGWGEVINGGFGMLLDGSQEAENKLTSMLHWDVNNGIARRNWARNQGAMDSIKRAMEQNPLLKVTLPNLVDDDLIDSLE